MANRISASPWSTYFKGSKSWHELDERRLAGVDIKAIKNKDKAKELHRDFDITIRVGADLYRRRGYFTAFLSCLKKIGRGVQMIIAKNTWQVNRRKRHRRAGQRQIDAFLGEQLGKATHEEGFNKSYFHDSFKQDLRRLLSDDGFQETMHIGAMEGQELREFANELKDTIQRHFEAGARKSNEAIEKANLPSTNEGLCSEKDLADIAKVIADVVDEVFPGSDDVFADLDIGLQNNAHRAGIENRHKESLLDIVEELDIEEEDDEQPETQRSVDHTGQTVAFQESKPTAALPKGPSQGVEEAGDDSFDHAAATAANTGEIQQRNRSESEPKPAPAQQPSPNDVPPKPLFGDDAPASQEAQPEPIASNGQSTQIDQNKEVNAGAVESADKSALTIAAKCGASLKEIENCVAALKEKGLLPAKAGDDFDGEKLLTAAKAHDEPGTISDLVDDGYLEVDVNSLMKATAKVMSGVEISDREDAENELKATKPDRAVQEGRALLEYLNEIATDASGTNRQVHLVASLLKSEIGTLIDLIEAYEDLLKSIAHPGIDYETGDSARSSINDTEETDGSDSGGGDDAGVFQTQAADAESVQQKNEPVQQKKKQDKFDTPPQLQTSAQQKPQPQDNAQAALRTGPTSNQSPNLSQSTQHVAQPGTKSKPKPALQGSGAPRTIIAAPVSQSSYASSVAKVKAQIPQYMNELKDIMLADIAASRGTQTMSFLSGTKGDALRLAKSFDSPSKERFLGSLVDLVTSVCDEADKTFSAKDTSLQAKSNIRALVMGLDGLVRKHYLPDVDQRLSNSIKAYNQALSGQ